MGDLSVRLRCKFFKLRKSMLRLLLVLLATGCATLEPPVNFEREGGDKSPTQQKEGAPLKVASEQEIQTLRPPIKIVGPFKAENDLSEPPNGEENAATDFAAEEEVKIPLTQQQAKLTERIKSAYAAQLELKEQLIKESQYKQLFISVALHLGLHGVKALKINLEYGALMYFVRKLNGLKE